MRSESDEESLRRKKHKSSSHSRSRGHKSSGHHHSSKSRHHHRYPSPDHQASIGGKGSSAHHSYSNKSHDANNYGYFPGKGRSSYEASFQGGSYDGSVGGRYDNYAGGPAMLQQSTRSSFGAQDNPSVPSGLAVLMKAASQATAHREDSMNGSTRGSACEGAEALL